MSIWNALRKPNRALLLAAAGVCGLAAGSAVGAERGFYGGVQLRGSFVGAGSGTRAEPLSWVRPSSAAMADEPAGQSLIYTGFRWSREWAIEASVSQSSLSDGRGVRLDTASFGLRPPRTQNPAVNVDVLSGWDIKPTFGVYGRFGLSLPDSRFAGPATLSDPVSRKDRAAWQFGVGIRYEFSKSLGLRAEWARNGRLNSDVGLSSISPADRFDNDQLSVGISYRF